MHYQENANLCLFVLTRLEHQGPTERKNWASVFLGKKYYQCINSLCDLWFWKHFSTKQPCVLGDICNQFLDPVE